MSGILRDRARRLEIGGAQRKKVRRSRTSTVAEGTIPARQRREAQLQKWPFEKHHLQSLQMRVRRGTDLFRTKKGHGDCSGLFQNSYLRPECRYLSDKRTAHAFYRFKTPETIATVGLPSDAIATRFAEEAPTRLTISFPSLPVAFASHSRFTEQ